MTASPPTRYRLDNLRRLATAMTSSLGVAPARAAALATHLLWFDAAGASTHGIATLPTWLERLETKQVDPTETGRVVLEHSGTAVFDAGRGLAPLALEIAAGIASEKARDVGIGIVRLRNVGPTGPSAPLASGLAIGPFVAMISGPLSLSIALPTADGLPAIYDSQLAGNNEPGSPEPPEGWAGALTPWISALAGEEGWVIVAVSVAAMETLTTFHDRVALMLRGAVEGPGQLRPESWARRQQEVRDHGASVEPAALNQLRSWAGRLNLAWPEEFGG